MHIPQYLERALQLRQRARLRFTRAWHDAKCAQDDEPAGVTILRRRFRKRIAKLNEAMDRHYRKRARQ